MANVLGEMQVRIVGDNRQLDKSIDQSQKKAKGFSSSLSKLFKGIGFGIAVVAVGKVTKALINAASNAEETRNKFNVVFKDISKDANQVAKDLSANFGLSGNAARTLLSDTGDLLTGFGFAQESALDLSKQVNELAVDLASFTNFSGGAEGASQALTKALLGERESVKSLGISILDADVKTKVLELTQQGMTFETERQAKAYATLLIAQEQSKNAIGDFARSSASFANQTRLTTAKIEDLQVALGEKLLPVANVGVGLFNDLLDSVNDSVDGIGDFVDSADGVDKISRSFGGIAGVFGVLKEFVLSLWRPLKEAITTMIEPLEDLDKGTGDVGKSFSLMGTVVQLISGALKIYSTVVAGVVTNTVNLVNTITRTAGVIGDFFGLISGKVSVDEFKASIASVKDSFADLGEGIIQNGVDMWGALIDTTINFTKAAKDSAEDFGDAFDESSERVTEKVKASLEEAVTATEEAADAEEQAIIESEAAKLEAYQNTADERLRMIIMVDQAIADRERRRKAIAADEVADNEWIAMSTVEKYTVSGAAASNFFSGIDALASAAGAAELQRLEESGASEEELDKKKKELMVASAKRQKAAAILQIGVDTPAAIVSALRLGPIAGPIFAGIIGAAAGLQLAAALAMPIPKFASGGIVAGSNFTGDKVPAMVNSGEMVLNKSQQARLLGMANGDTTNNNNQQVNVNAMFALGNDTQIRQAARSLFPFLVSEGNRRGTSIV